MLRIVISKYRLLHILPMACHCLRVWLWTEFQSPPLDHVDSHTPVSGWDTSWVTWEDVYTPVLETCPGDGLCEVLPYARGIGELRQLCEWLLSLVPAWNGNDRTRERKQEQHNIWAILYRAPMSLIVLKSCYVMCLFTLTVFQYQLALNSYQILAKIRF